LKHKGDKAAVGDVIGYMEPDGAEGAHRAPLQEQPRSEEQRKSEEPRRSEKQPKSQQQPPQPKVSPSAREEQVIPMTPIRRRIAERLVEAQKSAALLTTFNEIDMSAVLALRRQHQETFQAKYHIKLGLMSFFVKATIEALKTVPQLNAEVRGHDVVYRNYHDI